MAKSGVLSNSVVDGHWQDLWPHSLKLRFAFSNAVVDEHG